MGCIAAALHSAHERTEAGCTYIVNVPFFNLHHWNVKEISKSEKTVRECFPGSGTSRREGKGRDSSGSEKETGWERHVILFCFVTVTVVVITLAGGCTVDILGHKDLVRKMQWWGEESYPDFKKNKGYLWVGSMLWWWCFSKVIKSGCLWQSTPLPSCSLEVVNTASGLDPVQVGQMMPRATVHYFSKVDQGPHVLQSSGDILLNAVIDVLNQNIWKWDQRKWIFKINLSKLLCTKVWEFLFQGSPLSSQRPAPRSHKIIIAMNK